MRHRRRAQAAFGMLTLGIAAVLLGWFNQSFLMERWRWFTVTRPYMAANARALSAAAEAALKPIRLLYGMRARLPTVDHCPRWLVLDGIAANRIRPPNR